MLHPNINQLKAVCEELGDILDKVVFVGGATTTLYLTDKTQIPYVRGTEDVDMIIDLKRSEYHKAEEKLRKLGFRNVEDVICRYQKGNLVIDLMPIDPEILGFSNRWYKVGYDNAEEMVIDGLKLRVLSFPNFLATKLEAFNQRGKQDFLASKDMEDIVTVLAGRPGFLGELLKETGAQIDFIRGEFKNLLVHSDFRQSIICHVPPTQFREQQSQKIFSDLRELVRDL